MRACEECGEHASYTTDDGTYFARHFCDAHGPARKNYNAACMVCAALPTVGDTGLCGPCCFGEAETAGGNW